MTTIKPKDAADCTQFIEKRRGKIESHDYTVEIEKEWIPELGEDNLLLLAEHCRGTRRLLAASTDTPPNVLRFLAQDDDVWVRSDGAGNTAMPGNVLDNLARNESRDIQLKVVNNAKCPSETVSYTHLTLPTKRIV